MQKVIKRELIDTLQYMKIPHNRKFVDSKNYALNPAAHPNSAQNLETLFLHPKS
ncbi:hypothetical protein [Helicobacter bilis]|uniref:hypothetical protein n=1 Tax=Helicobacter bilis TaxID=37372 RepID=UPI0013151D88|nr:hypothetical protein [Helicobacter bilis]